MPKRLEIGVVTGEKMRKSIRVEIQRLVKNEKYGKFTRGKTVCHAHDENDEAKLGDTVEIRECRPRSKTKAWELVRIVAKSRLVDLAALRAAEKLDQVALSAGIEKPAGEKPAE